MKFSKLVLLLVTVSLFACSPGFGSKVSVDEIESLGNATKYKEEGNAGRVNVLKFSDSRPVETIIEINGRLVKPDGDLGQNVSLALERELRKRGMIISLFDSPTIRGSITEWVASVDTGFFSSSVK